MGELLIAIVSLVGYLGVAVGIMRPAYLSGYKELRVPSNGRQMSVEDAKRNAIKSAAQVAFSWPLLVLMGVAVAPLVVVFDLLPRAGRAVGRGVAAGACAATPVVAAPLVKWIAAPVEREIKVEAQLALEARADAGEGADSPLIPDSVLAWEPPKVTDRRVSINRGPWRDPDELLHWEEER